MDGHVVASMNEVVSNDFSSYHQAIDVVSANGVDDVIAFADGTVEIVVRDVKYTNHNTNGTATYGNFVKIRHDDGTYTLYAHMKYNSVLVSSGQRVTKGQVIGRMGDTGNAYGVHLHFEVRDCNNARLDPKDYLYGNKVIESSSDDLVISDSSDGSSLGDGAVNNIEAAFEGDEVLSNSYDDLDKGVMSESEGNLLDDSMEAFDSDVSYLENFDYKGGSIVDGLKGIGADSSFEYRSEIASSNGIDDYYGSYCQNVYLLGLLKAGKLVI